MMLLQTFTKNSEALLSPDLSGLESASLRLNKYTFIGKNSKKDQISAVCKLGENAISPLKFNSCDISFSMKLGARLMVNMAGGILENSGLCLHPFFNYPMIPGSALKGIAGHAAWLDWKNATDNEKTALAEKIVSVFGFPTGAKDLDIFIEEKLKLSTKKDQRAGKIAFINAIPNDNSWKLVPDVITPHGGNDYSNPVPNFFIAVEKGAEFLFSLKKTSRATDSDLDLAEKWLKKGLSSNGAGAKTAAGYGFFLQDTLQECKCITLKLVTPGFFGGADRNNKEDTLLRVSSLRGMLRWWWKTLYRDLLPDDQISQLEDKIWGSTSTGKSLISIKILSEEGIRQELYNYKERFIPKPAFKSAHNLMSASQGSTQGLFYLSYGMDEVVQQQPRRRFYLSNGASFNISISVRKGKTNFSEEDIRNQALAALSLLCRFGGIGSKARKGFGSLYWEEGWTLEKCRQEARDFCKKYGLLIGNIQSPYSWETAIQAEIPAPWEDPWTVIDRLGFAVQSFAQKYKHQKSKAVLGLPRKIHGPIPNRPIGHQRQETHRNPEDLYPNLHVANNGSNTRFASPIWYHIEPNSNGSTIRITAFPSNMIRDIETSKKMYEELIQHVRKKLSEYAQAPRETNSHPQVHAQRPFRQERQRFQPQTSSGYKAGDKVRAVLLNEKTKKGGWKAKIEGTDVIGPIQNNDKVPLNVTPGQQVELILKIAKGSESAFAWPERQEKNGK